MDLTTKPTATLRLLLACCASDPTGPLTVEEKAELWQKLGSRDWAPTPDDTPVPLATVEAWIRTLPTLARVFVEGIQSAEEGLP